MRQLIGHEALKKDYWVIHQEEDANGVDRLCVYPTKKEAVEASKGRDHKSRVVKFTKRGKKSW